MYSCALPVSCLLYGTRFDTQPGWRRSYTTSLLSYASACRSLPIFLLRCAFARPRCSLASLSQDLLITVLWQDTLLCRCQFTPTAFIRPSLRSICIVVTGILTRLRNDGVQTPLHPLTSLSSNIQMFSVDIVELLLVTSYDVKD